MKNIKMAWLFLACIMMLKNAESFYVPVSPYVKKTLVGIGFVLTGYVLYNEFRLFLAHDHWEALTYTRELYFRRILENPRLPKANPVNLAHDYFLLKKLESEIEHRKKFAFISRCFNSFGSNKMK